VAALDGLILDALGPRRARPRPTTRRCRADHRPTVIRCTSRFAQAFAARFPGVLRSVILDSTYPVPGLDPYYASSGSSGRAAMDRVCERDPGCTAAAGPGSATARLSELLARVRRAP